MSGPWLQCRKLLRLHPTPSPTWTGMVSPWSQATHCIYVYDLVGGAITILKNDGVKVNGNDDIPYMKWNIIQMFETTNHYIYLYMHNHSEDRIWNISEYHQKNPKDTKLSKCGISLKLPFFLHASG